MYVAGKMHRTFAMNRIPTGWIGKTEILSLQADHTDCFHSRFANESLGSLPRCPAGGAANDRDLNNSVSFEANLVFGCTKLVAIVSEADLPRQPASGWWFVTPRFGELLA